MIGLRARTSLIAIANDSCPHCEGTGARVTYKDRPVTCACAYRAAFRACLARFRQCAFGTFPSTVAWTPFESSGGGGHVYSRKAEEFAADFCLVARRVLTAEDHKIFRFYFLLGADWALAAKKLGMVRGNFFHAIYRIERLLGRAFVELAPYPLYPLNEYFESTIRH